MPSLPHRPALAPRDGISSFSSIPSSDTYYSNTEIRCLHDVVANAQDRLDDLPEGERLPTNALFQAYDDILPAYGIDPDEDHHISRLVFRVGGERGEGSLLEKLHNVLSRMGIELEFEAQSEGFRPFSDQGDNADHEGASQPSPPVSSGGHESVTTEDESFEYVQPLSQNRYKSSSASFESDLSDQHPSPPRLIHAALGSKELSVEHYQHLAPHLRTYSPSTAAGTEQSPQSHQSAIATGYHHGASDTTVQPAETAGHHPKKNEQIASSLPVRTKSIRTVNWLLPEDAETGPAGNGDSPAADEHRPHHQSYQLRYQPYQRAQQTQEHEQQFPPQRLLVEPHQHYQRYQQLEELQHEQLTLRQQGQPRYNSQSVYRHLSQPQQIVSDHAVPRQDPPQQDPPQQDLPQTAPHQKEAVTMPESQQQQYQGYLQVQPTRQSTESSQVQVAEHRIQQSLMTQTQRDQQDQQNQHVKEPQQFRKKQQMSSARNLTERDGFTHKQNVPAGGQQKVVELPSSDVKDFGQGPSDNDHQQPLVRMAAEIGPRIDGRDVSVDGALEENPEMEARYAWLERRANKAARYLQLLRGISHWETYAVEKRERMAVARRHILRMRHFDPWELVTANAKLKGRRILTSHLLTLWIRRVDEDNLTDHQASGVAKHYLAKRVLAAWSNSCPVTIGLSGQPRLISPYLQRWYATTSTAQALSAHVGRFGKKTAISQVSNLWRQQAQSLHVHVAAWQRLHVIRDTLSHWQLETRVESFRAKMGFKLIRDALSQWHSACRPPLPHAQTVRRTIRRCMVAQHVQLPARTLRGTASTMAISHRMLRTKVLDVWHLQASTAARTITRSRQFAARQVSQKVLNSWQLEANQSQSLATWSKRGRFYVNVNAALRSWRSKGTWRSRIRKAYARCRQHVKATTAKIYLSRWKSSARVHEHMSWQAMTHHHTTERHRLVLVLNAWLSESHSNWSSFRLLKNAWLGEWHTMSQDYHGTQSRSWKLWEETVKSRYWGQWQSTLLQLKSREYVASDVRERNKKKLVRRLLLLWKGVGDTGGTQQASVMRASVMRASLGASRKEAGIGPSQNSLQLSRAIHDRPGAVSFRPSRLQDFGPPVEEEDQDGGALGVDADGVVVNTPTRWTGMASSVTLPSMTPFAPLPTPFERELRQRYNRSMPPARNVRLSKLSFAEAQRLSAAEANARRTTNDSKTGPRVSGSMIVNDEG